MKLLLTLCFVLIGSGLAGQNSATIISKMIKAHGGLERWRNAATVSFEKEEQAPTMTIRSLQAVEPGSRRSHIVWPDLDAELYSDGENVWSSNWSFPFPPRMLALIDFYFMSLPWLTQDPGVVLGPAGKGRLPGDPKDYTAIKMTFKKGTGWTPDDYFTLMIDPDTYHLKGAEWISTDAAVLDANEAPANATLAGPFYYVIQETQRVDGLLLMTRFQHVLPDGTPFGGARFSNIHLDIPFDEAWTLLRENGQRDLSDPHTRKKN